MFLRGNSILAGSWPLIEQVLRRRSRSSTVFRRGNTPPDRSPCPENGREGRKSSTSASLFYIQSEQVSLVASSENEIERSLRARIVPSGLNGRGRPEMFVAIIICLRDHRYKRGFCPCILVLYRVSLPLLLLTDHVPPLLISLFCLLVFLPRFPTCLARASFRSFCLSANVR